MGGHENRDDSAYRPNKKIRMGNVKSSFHRLFVRDQLGLQIVQIHEKIAEIPTQIMRIALEKDESIERWHWK